MSLGALLLAIYWLIYNLRQRAVTHRPLWMSLYVYASLPLLLSSKWFSFYKTIPSASDQLILNEDIYTRVSCQGDKSIEREIGTSYLVAALRKKLSSFKCTSMTYVHFNKIRFFPMNLQKNASKARWFIRNLRWFSYYTTFCKTFIWSVT